MRVGEAVVAGVAEAAGVGVHLIGEAPGADSAEVLSLEDAAEANRAGGAALEAEGRAEEWRNGGMP